MVDYIKTQDNHHVKKLFSEEFKKLLDGFGIEYDERYIFHDVEQEPKDASLQDAEK